MEFESTVLRSYHLSSHCESIMKSECPFDKCILYKYAFKCMNMYLLEKNMQET